MSVIKVACSKCARPKAAKLLSAGLLCANCFAEIKKRNDCFGADLKESQCYYCFDREDCRKVAASADKSRRLKRRG